MDCEEGAAWLGGLLLGAVAMYLLDPHAGRRRRALLRDQVTHAAHAAGDSLERLSHDAANRSRGAVARTTRRLFPGEPVEPERLEARVRSALGRLCSHPGAVTVDSSDGIVTLSGTVLQHEIGPVLVGLRGVPGVRRVISQLRTVRDPAHESSLQGGRPRPGMLPDMLQPHMSPTSRAMVGAGGAALALAGMRRGGFTGMVAAGVGGFMIARALTNSEPAQLVHIVEPQPATVEQILEVQASVQEVFAFWSSFRNFPRFMAHLREVREDESGISHWVADGPAGLPVAWDAEITGLKPFERIAWRSVGETVVRNEGEVRFEEVEPARTRIHVRMTYTLPAGALGRAVAACFGADPARQINSDLKRLKSLLESGRGARSEPQTLRPDLQAR